MEEEEFEYLLLVKASDCPSQNSILEMAGDGKRDQALPGPPCTLREKCLRAPLL